MITYNYNVSRTQLKDKNFSKAKRKTNGKTTSKPVNRILLDLIADKLRKGMKS